MFDDLPARAAWIHEGARAGFEAVFIRRLARGWRFSGHTTAVEDGRPWTVRYEIGVDTQWRTRRAEAWIWNGDDPTRVSLRHDGAGKWSVNGASASRLDGCMDVDLGHVLASPFVIATDERPPKKKGLRPCLAARTTRRTN